MSDLFNSVFDFDTTALTTLETPTGAGFEMFNPKPEGSKEYIVTVRLLPFIKDVANSIVFKKQHWLKDVAGNFSVDSHSTFGGYCPVSRAYFNLDRSGIPASKKLAEELRINKQYVCYIQIISDTNKPENEGKILPWKMPVDIYKQVESWLKPSEEALKAGKKAKALLNPFKSFNIIITITNKTEGAKEGQSFRGYKAELSDEAEGFKIEGVELTDTPENRQKFVDLMTEKQTVDIVEKFAYVEPSADLKARVKHLLSTKYGQDVSGYWQDVEAKAPTAQPQGDAPSIAGGQPTEPAQPAQVMTDVQSETETKSDEVAQPAQGSESDIDSILDGI